MTAASNKYAFDLKFYKNDSKNINYNATAGSDAKVTEITAYIVVYDITVGESSQEVFVDYLFMTGVNNVLTKPNLVVILPTNVFIGVSCLNYTSGFSFDLAINSTDITLTRPTTSASFSLIGFNLWSFRKRQCNASTPYY